MEDFRVLIFLHTVESYFIVLTGLRLFGHQPNLRSLVFSAIASGLSIWAVRGIYLHFNITLGSHTLILTIILTVIIRVCANVSWDLAVGATLISVSLIMLGSGISLLLVQVLGFNFNEILEKTWLYIVIGYFENTMLIIMLLVNKITGFTLIKPLGIIR